MKTNMALHCQHDWLLHHPLSLNASFPAEHGPAYVKAAQRISCRPPHHENICSYTLRLCGIPKMFRNDTFIAAFLLTITDQCMSPMQISCNIPPASPYYVNLMPEKQFLSNSTACWGIWSSKFQGKTKSRVKGSIYVMFLQKDHYPPSVP